MGIDELPEPLKQLLRKDLSADKGPRFEDHDATINDGCLELVLKPGAPDYTKMRARYQR